MEAVGGSRAGAPRANKNRTCAWRAWAWPAARGTRKHFVPLDVSPQVCADTPLRPLPAPCRHYPLSLHYCPAAFSCCIPICCPFLHSRCFSSCAPHFRFGRLSVTACIMAPARAAGAIAQAKPYRKRSSPSVNRRSSRGSASQLLAGGFAV